MINMLIKGQRQKMQKFKVVETMVEEGEQKIA